MVTDDRSTASVTTHLSLAKAAPAKGYGVVYDR